MNTYRLRVELNLRRCIDIPAYAGVGPQVHSYAMNRGSSWSFACYRWDFPD
jgi:hypothetical protein